MSYRVRHENMGKKRWGFCNRVWKGKGWPERWKEGVIVIRKKRERMKVEEYRGVTLMPAIYNV